MTIINLSVADQNLYSPTKIPRIASGGKNENKVVFKFSDHWDGFTLKAIFYVTESTTYPRNILNNEVVIPDEVTATAGTVYLTLRGEKTSNNTVTDRRTSDVIAFNVVKGNSGTVVTPADQLEAKLNSNITKYNLTGITITAGDWNSDLTNVDNVCDAIAALSPGSGGSGDSEELNYLLSGLEDIFNEEVA